MEYLFLCSTLYLEYSKSYFISMGAYALSSITVILLVPLCLGTRAAIYEHVLLSWSFHAGHICSIRDEIGLQASQAWFVDRHLEIIAVFPLLYRRFNVCRRSLRTWPLNAVKLLVNLQRRKARLVSSTTKFPIHHLNLFSVTCRYWEVGGK